ncbi:hypothetical protein MRY87_11385 [bacterium]|nr:hypothetical protein [bacterium]
MSDLSSDIRAQGDQPPLSVGWTVLITTVLSLIPLGLYWGRLQRLFWFADEIALLHEWHTIGTRAWLVSSFGENVSPVYKVIWGGLVLFSGGNYDVMVLACWGAHLCIVALFALLLLRHGLPPAETILAAATVGMASSCIHLLTMSYHLNAALALLFALLALLAAIGGSNKKLSALLYLTLLVCSVLSFSRGIAFASGFCIYWLFRAKSAASVSDRRHDLLLAGLSLFPIALTFLLLFWNDTVSAALHGGLDQGLSEKLRYGITFFALNPLQRLLTIPGKPWSSSASVVVFLLIKLGIVFIGIRRAKSSCPALLPLLIGLIVFDLAHTTILGYGRAGEGVATTVALRYQRSSLIAFAPFFALSVFAFSARFFGHSRDYRLIFCSVVSTAWLLTIMSPWGPKLRHQVRWQGNLGREALLSPERVGDETRWHGVPPHLTMKEARETAQIYSFRGEEQQ